MALREVNVIQPQKPLAQRKKSGLFLSLLLLTAFLILAEITFLIQCSGIYLGDFKLMANHLSIPLGILPGILFFIGVQLFIHLSFTVLVWLVTIFACQAFDLSEQKRWCIGISLWFIALLTVLFANRIYFPNSNFSNVLFSFANITIAKILFIVCCLFLTPVILLAIFGFGLFILRHLRNKFIFVPVSLLCLFIFIFSYKVFAHTHAIIDAATPEKPNIIIIGMDSVRPDFLGFFGYEQSTPHIDGFLNHATVFSESLTPIARTYPSWNSILTGIYPKLTDIRTNLADQSHIDFSETLPNLLRQNGYHTLFATDDTRFSNIDRRYGFDKTITPPIGLNDFLIGTINDFPISNLLINTRVGEYLFPYSFGNRGVYATYDPNSFLKLMQPALEHSRNKPTLLIVHFCLPHYPYAWSTLPVKKVKLYHYQMAIQRVDQQFHDFMMMLQQNKLLEHSIVVLLSDHGEAVEMAGDRITDPDLFIPSGKTGKKIPHFYPPTYELEKVNMSGGHGTDVLGLSQYHTVLAFRTFGTTSNQIKIVPGKVSVMDIKPTLLTFLNLPTGKTSGHALQDYIFANKNVVDNKQHFFTESDFSPTAVRSVHPEERKVLFEGIDYFRIDPKTTRVVVRDSMMKMILSSKQFADYYDDWVLALYPQNKKTMLPVLVNLKTGFWTIDLKSNFAKNSPADHMLKAMKEFFGKDITSIDLSPNPVTSLR